VTPADKKRDKALVGAVTKAFTAALRNLRDTLRKEQSQLRYLGVWKDDAEYQRGNFATFKGGLWHCNVRGTRGAKPGDGSDAWTLAVKSGRES
jgi:hypothetical protein